MASQKRNNHSPAFKAKVAFEAVRGLKTANEIGQEYGVHPVQVSQWKKDLLEDSSTLFVKKSGPKPKAEYQTDEKLYSEIGRLKMELDWLKKLRDQPAVTCRSWIDPSDEVPLVQQCTLSGVARSTVYAQPKPRPLVSLDLELCHALDEIYTRCPFYGSRCREVKAVQCGGRQSAYIAVGSRDGHKHTGWWSDSTAVSAMCWLLPGAMNQVKTWNRPSSAIAGCIITISRRRRCTSNHRLQR